MYLLIYLLLPSDGKQPIIEGFKILFYFVLTGAT